MIDSPLSSTDRFARLTTPGPPSWREWLVTTVAAIAVLVVLRPVSVSEPYWWDASAVYVPGAHWLETHHFAARPGVFPSDLSRGHTPLFYLALAFAFRLFGTTPAVGHLVVLACGVATVALTYALGRLLAGPLAGASAALLVLASTLFLTMSSEALPEIPCTALTMAVLYTFARGRYAACAAWGCALVLTKELTVAGSAAVAGALLFTAIRQRTWKRDLGSIATLAVPAIPLVVFFAWQRIAEGWFITPYHASLFNTPHSYLESFAYVMRSLFAIDARWLVMVPAAAFAIAAMIGRSREPSRAAAAPSAPDATAPATGTVCTALALLVLANIVFYVRGWFLDRYALPAHPAIAILASYALTRLPRERTRRAGAAILVVATLAAHLVAASNRESGQGFASGETTFRYVRAIRVQRQIFERLARLGPHPVVMTTWPMSDELRWPYLGYVSRPYQVVNADYVDPAAPPPHVDAIIVFLGVGSAQRLRSEAARRRFGLIATESLGGAICELYAPRDE